MRKLLSGAQKFFIHLHGRMQHIYQNIFLITDDDNNLITDDGNPLIDDQSDY